MNPAMTVMYVEPLGRVYDVAVLGGYVCTVDNIFGCYNIGDDPSYPYTEGPTVTNASG